MKEAMLYEKLDDEKVHCYLCAHNCTIQEGKVGICQVRENQEGILYTRVYGRAIAQHVDPIEKKPLLHFHPGSRAYSVATPGCNFRCKWCQNADISQAPRQNRYLHGRQVGPKEILSSAQQTACHSIAYTYTEPTIFFEYSYDTAKLAQKAGLANVYVTNGYMTAEMLDKMHPYLDAANVDLKGFREKVYRKYAGARLQPVLDSLKKMKELDIWVEVTTLIIPGINDDPEELGDVANFIAEELGPETPWHISRFSPAYEMTDVPPTSLSTLLEAQEIGKEAGLRYIYVGNVPNEANTICHECNHVLIRRLGYQIMANNISEDATCPECGTPMSGRGMEGNTD